jgi:hypothetical protein
MEPRKPWCVVVNNKDYNLEPAKTYGDLVVIYEGQPHDVFMTSKHAFLIKQKLEGMQSSDYLVVVGNMILNMIAFGIILERFGYVNALLFDVRTMTYVPRAILKHQLQS